ncbi:hypothetical protein TNCV_1314331 [Trichonephila clavipes]|nr:hypothetical protein TNCV_1314331 [Trichonephila clavipes]
MRRDAPFDFHPPHALPSFTKHSTPAINHLTRRGLFTIHGVLAFMDDRYTSPKNPIIPKTVQTSFGDPVVSTPCERHLTSVWGKGKKHST